MSGDLKVLSETNGFSSYEVSSGLVTFSYFPNGTVIGASDTDWHLIEDSASEVNGEKIDQKIRNGVVILQTSIDGTNWITELVKGNIAGSETDYSENFYETAEIQLVNGCYYRVKMAQLNKRKSVLDQMRKQLPKAREEQRSYMSRNTVPEYRYINYDLELIKKEYETVSKTIMEMQMALDKYNQTVQFEVDI